MSDRSVYVLRGLVKPSSKSSAAPPLPPYLRSPPPKIYPKPIVIPPYKPSQPPKPRNQPWHTGDPTIYWNTMNSGRKEKATKIKDALDILLFFLIFLNFLGFILAMVHNVYSVIVSWPGDGYTAENVILIVTMNAVRVSYAATIRYLTNITGKLDEKAVHVAKKIKFWMLIVFALFVMIFDELLFVIWLACLDKFDETNFLHYFVIRTSGNCAFAIVLPAVFHFFFKKIKEAQLFNNEYAVNTRNGITMF